MYPIDRALGSFQAMMIADAMSYPSMMRGRYMTLPWIDRTMHKIEAHGQLHRNTKPVLPFVWHKSEVLQPTPTYVTEYALFTARMLTELQEDYSQEAISGYWIENVVECEQEVRSGVSERSAIENFKKGYMPPVTGNDHPHTYDDGFVCRSIAIGMHAFDRPELMDALLHRDGTVTHADEGLHAGNAMAAAIAAGMRGASADEMLTAAIAKLPPESWVGAACSNALRIAESYQRPFEAIPQLDNEATSRIYSYGNVSAETLSIAFALFAISKGDLHTAIPAALAFPRLSDSVPAFVGALCGVHAGVHAIPAAYRAYLRPPQGVCLPSIKDADVEAIVRALIQPSSERGRRDE